MAQFFPASSAVTVPLLAAQPRRAPGGDRYLPTADPRSFSVSATNLMWSFFASHPKP